MRKLTSLIAFTVALIGSIAVQAQVYPVQGNGVLIPPYSVYLADYTEGTSDRIVLNVVLNDVSRPDLRVRLRAKIIGQSVTLETKPEYIGREFVLEGGIPLRLTGIDLAEYFDPVNLNFSGISRREFEKTGALPQGLYQFCFEVLEYNRGVKISNTICANGWLILNDPPIINLPRNGEKLVPTQPQNIVFQWTPRHTGSPNSAFTTEYDVKLVELWPANRNPNDAILTSPPILEETTRSTTFIYDVSQTPLELGRYYALQIKAKSIAGADELDLFKNNGKSEVVTFIYGDPCTVPQNILLEATSATRFTARWAGDFNHTGYSLRYRLADNPSAPWYTNTTLVPDAAISGLQPNTTYEVQIAGGCGVFESLYSGTARIKTFDTSEQGYSCGMPLEQFNLDPANLLDILNVGDIIQAGDFDVKIAKVSGSNGTFTGEGVIEVPFFNKARVKAEFASIVVNKDMRMVNGYLNVTGAGVDIVPSGVLNMMDELIGAADSALTNLENNRQQPFDPNAFVPDTTLTLPGPVTVTDDNGTVVITDANGVQHRLPPGTEAAIVDDQGNGTLIDSKGKAHAVSGAVATAAANREYNLALKFTEAKNNPTYGFDALDEPDAEVFKILANRYTKLEDNYYVPYKSVETGHTTTVTGELEGSGIDKGKIRFQQGGVTMPSTPFSGNESTVTVSGKADGEEEWLIAVLPAENGTGKDQVLGRVNVVSYNKINKNVVIIPVNGNTFSESEGTALQTELNKIYNQAVVSWSVSVRSGIQVAGIDPFDVGATGMLTNYTRHMKDVINAYQDNMKDGVDTYYLFLVKNPTDPEIDGVMPRSKNYGFIFMDKSENSTLEKMARTMAHELGHGAFNLHHTFMEEDYSLRKGETDNLMDYAGGTKLYKYQWDMIRNPPIVVGMMESDEEGMSQQQPQQGIILTAKTAFITPIGSLITLPAGAQIYYACDVKNIFINGTLLSFKVDDVMYYANANAEGNLRFINYRSDDNKVYPTSPYDAIQVLSSSEFWLAQQLHDVPTLKLFKAKSGVPIVYINNMEAPTIQDGEWDLLKITIESKPEQEKTFNPCSQSSSSTPPPVLITGSGYKIIVTQVVNGKFQAKVVLDPSLQKDPRIPSNQLAQLQNELSRQATEKLNELGGLEKNSSPELALQTEDSGEFRTKSMNGLKWLHTIGHLGATIWEKGALPEEYWNKDKGYSESSIHLPPTFAGIGNGLIEKVMEFPQLAKLGYDVGTKKEVRDALWNSVRNLTPESVKEMAIGAVNEELSQYNFTDRPHLGYHKIGKMSVVVVTAVFGAATLLNEGADALEKGVKEAGEIFAKKAFNSSKELLDAIVKARKKIRKVLNAPEGMEYARKYFNKFETGDFDTWYKNTFKKFDRDEPLNFEVHHVIPVNVLEKSTKLQDLLYWANQTGKKLEFNSIDNGIPLPKKSLAFDVPGHAHHPDYDDLMTRKIDNILDDLDLNEDEKFSQLSQLINKAKTKLENDVLLGGKDVNAITDF